MPPPPLLSSSLLLDRPASLSTEDAAAAMSASASAAAGDGDGGAAGAAAAGRGGLGSSATSGAAGGSGRLLLAAAAAVLLRAAMWLRLEMCTPHAAAGKFRRVWPLARQQPADESARASGRAAGAMLACSIESWKGSEMKMTGDGTTGRRSTSGRQRRDPGHGRPHLKQQASHRSPFME